MSHFVELELYCCDQCLLHFNLYVARLNTEKIGNNSEKISKCRVLVPFSAVTENIFSAKCSILLDGLKGSYAVFRAVFTYEGPIIRIRRSSDNSTLDFFSDTFGSLGSLFDGAGTSIYSWLDGDIAFVSIWYDQSGLARHATQTDCSYQPMFDVANKRMDFTAQSGTAYLNLPDGTVPQQVPYTVIAKHHNINNREGPWLSAGLTGIPLATNVFSRMGSSYINSWWTNDLEADGYAQENTVTFSFDGSYRNSYINGHPVSSLNHSNWNGQTGQESIAYNMDLGYLNGELYFLHIFATCLNEAERNLAESGYLHNCTAGKLNLGYALTK